MIEKNIKLKNITFESYFIIVSELTLDVSYVWEQ